MSTAAQVKEQIKTVSEQLAEVGARAAEAHPRLYEAWADRVRAYHLAQADYEVAIRDFEGVAIGRITWLHPKQWRTRVNAARVREAAAVLAEAMIAVDRARCELADNDKRLAPKWTL